MPELPEVQTIVNDLNRKIKGLTITGVWTDWPKYFRRSPGGFGGFKKEVINKKINKIWRIGKNIIFYLSGGKIMLIHQKMTGHLLVGAWRRTSKGWVSNAAGPMEEKVNGYIHAMFWLDGKPFSAKAMEGTMMGFSDLRKFGKILTVDNKNFQNLIDIKNIGPDPLKAGFSFERFKNLMVKQRGIIKKILMDQKIISGIGNIYADEILFVSKIHPLRKIESLTDRDLRFIFRAIQKILKRATKLRGTSISDYRDTAGEAGYYTEARLVYRREGQKCFNKCGGAIKRIKIGGRSAHFCPSCQKL